MLNRAIGQFGDVNNPFHAVAQLHEDSELNDPGYVALSDITGPQPKQLPAMYSHRLPILLEDFFSTQLAAGATSVDHCFIYSSPSASSGAGFIISPSSR